MPEDAEKVRRRFNAALDFALDPFGAGVEGLAFLALWRSEEWDVIREEWPEFKIEDSRYHD